ncbi:MAG: orotidine-5'-phosphate decarboxylase [Hyphomicrobiaceae bacterium]
MSNATARDRLIVALDMPTVEAARLLVHNLDKTVTFYKVGLELLFAGGLEFAQELRHQKKRVFLDMKLLDIGNTVERAVANAAELGLTFLTVHGTDTKTMRAAVNGRGSRPLKLLAVTVLTNLTAEDLEQQGSRMSPADLVLHRAKLAHQTGFDGVIASGQEAARIRAETAPDFLIVTPGIRLLGGTADDQARITTPDSAINAGADYLVVGRPITEASDPACMAEAFIRHIRDAHAKRGKG